MIGYPRHHGIEDCFDLQAMKYNLNQTNRLDNDIDCSDSRHWNDGWGFEPIGHSKTSPFTGELNGHQYVIKDLYVSLNGEEKIGLFYYLRNGGLATNFTLYNPRAREANTGSNDWIYASAVSSIVSSNGKIDLVAVVNGNTTTTDTTGSWDGAGLMTGAISGGVINRSFATGYGSYVDGGVGGIAGVGWGTSKIENTFTLSSIGSLSGRVGGIVGDMESSSLTLRNVYAAENLRSSNAAGGIAGYRGSGTCTNAYFDSSVQGSTTSACGTAKTTSEMQTQSTFSGFDFTNTWFIDGYYPMLYGFMSLDSNSISSTSGDNLVSDNITVSIGGASRDGLINVTDWRLDGESIAVLNMPFERVLSIYNETRVRDYSTNANDGVLGEGTDAYEPRYVDGCQVGNCLKFDGINDYVYEASDPITNDDSDVTFSAWVKPSSTSGAQYVLTTGAQTSSTGYAIPMNGVLKFLRELLRQVFIRLLMELYLLQTGILLLEFIILCHTSYICILMVVLLKQ